MDKLFCADLNDWNALLERLKPWHHPSAPEQFPCIVIWNLTSVRAVDHAGWTYETRTLNADVITRDDILKLIA